MLIQRMNGKKKKEGMRNNFKVKPEDFKKQNSIFKVVQ